MSSIDQRIQNALSEEDNAILDKYCNDQSVFSEIAISFRGIRGYFVVLVWVMMLILAPLFLFSAFKFFNADSVDEKVTWLGAGFVLMMSGIACKLWYYMELNRNAIMIQLKRLELQLSLIAEKIPPA